MSFQLFDRIRAYFKGSNLYNDEKIATNQTDMRRLTYNGNFINFNDPNSIINNTELVVSRLTRYSDYLLMDQMGEISLSLDMYADESTQMDTERKHSLLIKSSELEIKQDLEFLFYNIINIDAKLRPLARYLCKYGDIPLRISVSPNRDSVVALYPLNAHFFTRIETRLGDLVGFYYNDVSQQQIEPIFMHPYEVAHFRLLSFENTFAPYGSSVLEGARKDFKRLRLMEDAALIYRVVRAPEKRVFKIPVGDLPTNQQYPYLKQIANQYKRGRFYDPETGEVNFRYSPQIQEDDFWLPVRSDGTGPTIEVLQGAENLDQIADIEYFKKKVISALKVPFGRVGIGNDQGVGSDKSLSSSSSEFSKAVQWIQREIAYGLKKVALVHLALRGYPLESIHNFDLTLTASSAIDELYRIETWSSRATVIGTLKDTGLFPDDWLVSHFTDLTDDEIEEMKVNQPKKEEEESMPDIGDLPGLGESSDLNVDLHQKVITEYQHLAGGKRVKPKPLSSVDALIFAGEVRGLTEASGCDIINEGVGLDDVLVVEAKETAIESINGDMEEWNKLEKDKADRLKYGRIVDSGKITEDDIPRS